MTARPLRNIAGKLALVASGLVLVAACGDNQTVAKDRTPYVSPEPQKLTCVPNLDGKIEASEAAPTLDVPVRFLVSPAGKDQTVDLVPKPYSEGVSRWDYSVDKKDDQVATIVASSIKGRWYEKTFPETAFVGPNDAGGRVESVYSFDGQTLFLLGLASKEPNPAEGQTLYAYTAPVALYKFPLIQGLTYTSIGEAKNATLRGLPYAGRDIYEVKVDAIGQLDLPDVVFQQALRVRTKVTLEPSAGQATTQLQVSFFFECFGEVARVTSKPGEKNEDFTVASEVRRFGLP